MPFGLQARKGWEDVGGRRALDPDRRTGASTEARARRGLERFRWAAREAAGRTRAVQQRAHREEKYYTPSGLLDGDLFVHDYDEGASDRFWFDDGTEWDLDGSAFGDDYYGEWASCCGDSPRSAPEEYDLVPAWYRRAAPSAWHARCSDPAGCPHLLHA